MMSQKRENVLAAFLQKCLPVLFLQDWEAIREVVRKANLF